MRRRLGIGVWRCQQVGQRSAGEIFRRQAQSLRFGVQLLACSVGSSFSASGRIDTYDSGHSGEAPLAAFAIRGRELVIYLIPKGDEQKSLLSRLGPHKMGKSCLYFKRLADLDRTVLEELVAGSVASLGRRYGGHGVG